LSDRKVRGTGGRKVKEGHRNKERNKEAETGREKETRRKRQTTKQTGDKLRKETVYCSM
jgi:hypothetical protein